ncbi:SPOR domain-containing protein [Shimia sp. MMG029]|uniref:SPOR domain-containing protein n=1 Tax=Shimia sp. MMG029 TaxID=3021978 RepID=UPI0022FDC668|nr:SPOR domain-containing protein [Shimia sp. MMG029]MDA5555400.1 SPOR domain-containing protein [Shimia sp. MMG029]
MAELPMGAHGVPKGDSPNAALLVNRAGMLMSVALVVGAGVWGYQILSRDVSGVPVVRALEGPMRVQPDDPGGRQAGHQGLMVNEVAADGGAAGPADQVIVAPPPIALTERDRVAPPVASRTAPAAEQKPTQPSSLIETDALTLAAAGPIVAPVPLDVSKPLSVTELAEQLAAGATPLSGAEVTDINPTEVSLTVTETAPEPEVVETPEIQGGIKRSLRPVLRPAGLSASPRQQQIAAIDAAVGSVLKSIDPSEIPAGTRLVQLGAYETAEIASAEWARLQSRFEPYLGDKTRVIQKASSGGRVFYRLRAMGFDNVSDARRLCSALKAENADCIPVTTR